MKKGVRVKLLKQLRHTATGKILPREAIYVDSRDSLGRELCLLDFGSGLTDCVFANDLEQLESTEAI